MSEQEIFHFATIGEIFEDGVSLIFDGQDAATEKHYKVNTSIVFKAGDRVKILADSGTYVVEYVVGPPKQPGEEIVGVPAGGTTGQSLLKETDDNHAVVWGTPNGIIPTGGVAGQVLKKKSATDHDVQWGVPDGVVPAGGNSGQVLKKSGSANYDMTWGDPEGAIPAGGAIGQVLKKSANTNYSVQWGNVDGVLPAGGTNGQCLIKNGATNYAAKWGAPTSANSVVNQYQPTYETSNLYFQTDYSGNFYIRKGTSGTWKKITVT